MKISIVTDEVSADPETAIELGSAWGVSNFELRGYYAERAPNISRHQRQRLRDVLDYYSAHIVALSPGLFKFPLPAEKSAWESLAWMDRAGYESWDATRALVREHLEELLPTSIEYARELGVQQLVSFGLGRGAALAGAPPGAVIDVLGRAAEQVAAAGLKLAIENEDGFWADTGVRTAAVIRAVNNPALGINWDPGNAFFAGEVPYPNGYAAVRGLVQHVHFKETRTDADGHPECVAEGGVIDWDGQIRDLAADGYDGHVSIETHVRPKVAGARLQLERLRALIAAATHQRPVAASATYI
jgi:sugar phosphate isomerase/epimerase